MTLASVKQQTYPFIEHLIIDGGSTDGTKEIVTAFSPGYFVSEKDDGIYYAMQKGVEVAKGDIVFFLNSGDTFFDDNVVSEVVKFFNLTGCDAVFGNLFPCYIQSGDSHDHRAFRDHKVIDLSYFNNRKLFFDESIHHQTIFYKRKIFDQCGFICNETAANGEYHLNLCAFIKHDYSVKHLPMVICRFALGGTSTSCFRDEWRRFDIARNILRKIYFANGQKIKIENENEYLWFPPSLRNRIKIKLRKWGVYSFILLLKGQHLKPRVSKKD